MKQTVGTRVRESYEAAIAGVWTDLRTTLHRLEVLAADPDEALGRDDAPERLGGLQYSLHRSAELVSGLEPPTEAEPAHEELAEALTDARDATAEIAYVLDVADAEAAKPYVYEWRGALFRVRLAQLRLAGPAPAATAAPGTRVRSVRGSVLVWALAGILLLVALGLIAFALGALAGTR
ncbi:MAG: hypothetical protein ABI948_00930 [Thermoleophilia bacterium]